jgi:hypothetical protein
MIKRVDYLVKNIISQLDKRISSVDNSVNLCEKSDTKVDHTRIRPKPDTRKPLGKEGLVLKKLKCHLR